MCGIAGYFSPRVPRYDADLALRMLTAIEHRGPDDQGVALFDVGHGTAMECATAKTVEAIQPLAVPVQRANGFAHHLAFVHCRYSIVDLSPSGHQPMWDPARAVCLSFNGEIYNYLELREELEATGAAFSSHSDTEVLLAGYMRWGVDVFQRLNGQWALSLFDRRSRRLLLSRDRLGKVPLYFAEQGGGFFWASEIKAIVEACGRSSFSVRDEAVDDFVMEGLRDRDGTFWNEVHDFPPGSYGWLGDDLQPRMSRYWSLPGARLATSAIAPAEAANRLRELLVDAIRIRARADVPVAFELSGGVDSSSLVALAAQDLDAPVTAYTVRFPDKEGNEEPFARMVAERFGAKIDYRVIEPTDEDFWREADRFIWVEEEPFHAPSLHTNHLLRRRMKASGTRVVISGAAGDEVFAGYYGEYFSPFLRHLAATGHWGRLVHELGANSERPKGWKGIARAGLEAGAPGLLGKIGRTRRREAQLLRACYRRPAHLHRRPPLPTSLDGRMRANMGTGKMNYWLRSANKANFAIPIEPRAPYLDYRVVDFAFSLPPEFLIRGGWHKWILRQAVAPLLPEGVLWRRTKMGFPFPITSWLLSSKARIKAAISDIDSPYLDRTALFNLYEDLARTAPYTLWRLVSLGLWWRRVVEGRRIETAALP